MLRRFIAGSFFVTLIWMVFGSQTVLAAPCAITADTVIDQAYVTTNSCTSVNIQGSVSTTWIGTVDLGGGTVTVETGNTMTMGSSSQMILGAADDLVVQSGAAVTHRSGDIQGVYITARNITVTGDIAVAGKGCSGTVDLYGYGPVTTSTGECAYTMGGAGQYQYGGAGHGGAGGTLASPAGITYGSSTEPTFLGSSGGGAPAGGGQGGGRIYLEASDTLIINGSVSANGSNGGSNQGGGSGGSVYIRAATLAGSGTISANGGNGNDIGAPGGGGRIAIFYTSATFPVANTSSVTVTRGTGGGDDNAKNGTAYILDRFTDDGGGNLLFNGGGLFYRVIPQIATNPGGFLVENIG